MYQRSVTTNFLRTLSASTARLINEKDTIMPFTRRVVHIIQTGFIMSAATSLIMAFLSEDIKNNVIIFLNCILYIILINLFPLHAADICA